MVNVKTNRIKKISAFITAVFIACGFLASSGRLVTFADTISELEARQDALEAEKKNLEKSLAGAEGKIDEIDEYLALYDEKMKTQEEQLDILNEQIDIINAEIEALNISIAERETEVEEGIDLFRQRLRVLYINGNDSLASVLAGSGDFYDMLARMELFERISKQDNEMIEDLNTKISDLKSSQKELEEKLSASEEKKLQAGQYLAELRETWNNHAETKEMEQKKLDDYAARGDEIERENERIEQQIQEEIRRQQEEAERRRKEEEERRRLEEEKRKKEAEEKGETYIPKDTEIFKSYSDTGFIWPVPTVRNMTDGYGNRWIIEESRNDFHKGIDITKPGCAGQPIVASAGGEVITAGNTGNGYGYHVVIDHGNKTSTLYGHCSSLDVKTGDIVKQGDVVGYIGSTGYSYGNHLHFEVRINGQHTDPLDYVSMNN